jgi:hypothetical protein
VTTDRGLSNLKKAVIGGSRRNPRERRFWASGNIDGTFKKLVGAFVKASFYHCVIGAADDVAGRMRMLTRARSCVALVDRVDLATPLSLSSQPLPASRLSLPRSGLERSDFVL